MSRLQNAFDSGKFVITCELSPPKGVDLAPMIDKARVAGDAVDAFNVTDSAAARMTMDPTVAAHALLQHGFEPIVQVTSRDKNRLALQSGMLGAHALGVANLVMMGGDPPHIGDHPEAKGVNDLFSAGIIEAAAALNRGVDHAGNRISGHTDFFIGAVCNPGATDRTAELDNTRRKLDAGARFLQTQAIYQPESFAEFVAELGAIDAPILAGIIPIKSVKMAKYMNERVPGIDIPPALIERIADVEKSGDADAVLAASLDIAATAIDALRAHCAGVHVMAIGWERHVAALLARAGC